MKRIIYLSLLLVIPFILSADHGRDRLNGKWVSSYYGKTIKLKVKRQYIKVKGLYNRGWTKFSPIGRRTFEDRNGNTIKINNIHDLVFRNRYQRDRISFVKRGHEFHNHRCDHRCSIGDDYFYFKNQRASCSSTYGGYNDYGYSSWKEYPNDYSSGYNSTRGNNDNYSNGYNNDRNSGRISGKYHVRELDEYIELKQTRRGLKARRGNGKWASYNQNTYRKNEYRDQQGNRYILNNDGSIKWRSRDGNVSLSLER